MSKFQVGAALALALLLITGYSNCAQPNQISPLDELQRPSLGGGAFAAVLPMSSLASTQSMTIATQGGTPPYNFTLVSGTAVVDANGTIHGPYGAGGAVVIEAADAAGAKVRLSFQVGVTVLNYLGAFNGFRYMVTPGGCEASGFATCPGTVDNTLFIWGDPTLRTGANSTTDGAFNTNLLATSFGGASEAAKYCYYLNFAGYSDWFLPAIDELTFLYNNRASVSGLDLNGRYFYWSSSEYVEEIDEGNATVYAKSLLFTIGSYPVPNKSFAHRVRCMRKD